MEVTAIFDIGKTNKKFFLFDEHFREVYSTYTQFEEVVDDDGFPCEDLQGLVSWIMDTYQEVSESQELIIKNLNFSTYGASLVHLDENNQPVTPFYNYLKPYPKEILLNFYQKHGEKEHFELTTASPSMGMLNSGLQLYYLKYHKPELFSKIRKTLHLPHYLSSMFTNKHVSDYTSLGCHTGLWDMEAHDYAEWVYKEGFTKLLCPIVFSDNNYIRNGVRVGVGIHDSSSALIPYQKANKEKFALISTGTWSICMNPYNHSPLDPKELSKDCLTFLNDEGLSVKASRLFLGKHLDETANILSSYFGVANETYKKLQKPGVFESKRMDRKHLLFDHSLLDPKRFGYINQPAPDYTLFDDYEDAFLHFFDELTDLQIASLSLVVDEETRAVFLDGGMSESEIFTKLLTDKLPDYQVYSSSFPLGSALGAALMVIGGRLPKDFLASVYKVRQMVAED